ncbi:hypothetical protein [Pseudomonas sp. 18173]|uniref:hypothetical protein n=1 Tax=Pseudomonas sp. 18173 TaxID=3390055 RepID=UPI003D1E5C48
MSNKNKVTFIGGGIHLHKIPYKLNQLPYKPTITLAIDKLTQSTISFTILETPTAQNIQIHTCPLKTMFINYIRNALARQLTGNPDYFRADSSPQFTNASYVKAMKEFALQPKLAGSNKVVGTIQIDHTVADIFVSLSQPLHRYAPPLPKNPPFGELWRQRGHRFPQSQ